VGRLSRNYRLESRDARAKLKPNKEPYWHQINTGLFLGYYKGKKSAVWFVRRKTNEGKYQKIRIGLADDYQDANGISVYDYKQAHRLAIHRDDHAVKDAHGTPTYSRTTKEVMNDYLNWFKLHRKSYSDTKNTVDKQITPQLGDLLASELTPRRIKSWQEGLITANKRYDEDDPESVRRAKSTANRVLTVLKAALNHAYLNGDISDDTAWRIVKPFKAVEAPKIRHIDQAECKRLIDSSEPDFRNLVKAALFTGCRYGELTKLLVSDFNSNAGTIYIHESKSGHPRHVPLTDEGIEFFTDICKGQKKAAHAFLRMDGKPWGKSHQSRPMLDACKKAEIDPPVSFHILRHTYGSLLAMNGAPLQVIAQALGHADTRITEKHYAHLQPDHVANAIRQNLPSFGDKTP